MDTRNLFIFPKKLIWTPQTGKESIGCQLRKDGPMEQHAEGKISHENFMTELINGEKNGALAAVDFEIPEIPEPLKTPEIMDTIIMFQNTQEVS